MGGTWAAPGIRGDYGGAEGHAARRTRRRRAGRACRPGRLDRPRRVGALQHTRSRGRRVRRGLPAGLLADDSAPGRVGAGGPGSGARTQPSPAAAPFPGPLHPAPYFTVSLSTSRFTPDVVRARRSASFFSSTLFTTPVSVTTLFLVSTSIFRPPTFVSASSFVFTAVVTLASATTSFVFTAASLVA